MSGQAAREAARYYNALSPEERREADRRYIYMVTGNPPVYRICRANNDDEEDGA